MPLLLARVLTAGLAISQLLPMASAQSPGAATGSSPRGQGDSRPLTTAQIAARSGDAVVTIVTSDAEGRPLAQGSGFVLRPNGIIVTNWHVMVGAATASVSFKTGESFDRVSFLAGDESADVVVLKIPATGLPSMAASLELPQVGSRVVALGSPLGLTGTVSEGIVSAVRLVDGRQLVQISAAISPGSSGGPVIDSAGRVFAIATESLEGKGIQQLNFAVPVKYAAGLLNDPLNERPLTASPLARAPFSDFSVSARDFSSWSRPDPSRDPLHDLSGQYAWLSRQTSRSSGSLKSKGLGFLVVGRDVGLWASMSKSTMNVQSFGPLTGGAAGTVAFRFSGATFVGYQTQEGFLAALEGTTDEVLEIQAKRTSIDPAEANGVYRATVNTQAISTVRAGGRTFPVVGEAVEWSGEAAIIVLNTEIHIDLLLTSASGGSVRFNAAGSFTNGRFDLNQSGKRLTGSLVEGLIEAQWIDGRTPDLRFEGLFLAERPGMQAAGNRSKPAARIREACNADNAGFAPRATPKGRAQAWSAPQRVREPVAVLSAGVVLDVASRSDDWLIVRFADPLVGERVVHVRCSDVRALP